MATGTLSLRAPTLSGASEARPNQTLREHCDERAKSLIAERREIDTVVAEISSLTQQTRGRFMPATGGKRRKTMTNRLYDGYGGRAAEILTNGMTSGLSSPSRPWFRSRVADPDLMKFFAVTQWFAAVDRAMYDFMASTNFYAALKTGYSEIGLFGTEACFMAEHWKAGMVCHAQTWGEYWTAVSDTLAPDTLLRQAPMTTRQVVAQFVASRFDKRELDWSKVSNPVKVAWDNSNYDTVVDIMHLVEPNPAWDPARFDAAGKPWRSIYWEAKSDRQKDVLEAEGHSEQPFWCARWQVSGNDVWGVGPGWNALADLRGLQLQVKRKGDATDMAIKPPMVGPASVKLKMQPGSYTSAAQLDKDAIRPAFQADFRAIKVVGEDVLQCKRDIDGYFYVDIFMAITQMDGVQPRNTEEIFSRNEEKMTQLGGVIERVNGEKLGVGIDRVFGICLRRGMFPAPPEELHGKEILVDYISILAQAQRAAGLSIVERSLGFLGNVSKAFPGVLDNVDGDGITIDYLERSGFPAVGIRDPKKRDEIRAAREKVIAAQQAKDTMPAVQQGADAAELLSRTDIRGGHSLLDALMTGGAGG